MQSRLQKEDAESDQFWDLLGGKSEYPSQRIARDAESDPILFSCNFSKGVKKKKFISITFLFLDICNQTSYILLY